MAVRRAHDNLDCDVDDLHHRRHIPFDFNKTKKGHFMIVVVLHRAGGDRIAA